MNKVVVQKRFAVPPYSLHDARLTGLIPEGDTIRLNIQCGYVETTAPFEVVDGDVEITGLDWDFCWAYMMDYPDVLCGNCGSFVGEKLSIPDFLKKYQPVSIDVIDETYGYRQVKFSGFLNHESRCLEVMMEFCYAGEFRYLLKY